MNDLINIWMQFMGLFLGMMAIIAGVAILGLMLMVRSLRNIRVPPGADFFTTMHYVPFGLVVLLDLLDLGLDIFSAPVAWLILDRMGMPNLRNTAALQGIVPLTGPVPVLTIAWVLTRLFGLGDRPGMCRGRGYPVQAQEFLDDIYYATDDYSPPPQRQRPVHIIDADDR